MAWKPYHDLFEPSFFFCTNRFQGEISSMDVKIYRSLMGFVSKIMNRPIQSLGPSNWHPTSQHHTVLVLRYWHRLSWRYFSSTPKTSSRHFQHGTKYPLSVNLHPLTLDGFIYFFLCWRLTGKLFIQDVHVEIMERHYENVPTKWYAWIGGSMLCASIFVVLFYPLQVA
jgi:hypothetical protein